MSIYKDGKLIAGGRQCMPLLSFMWADHQLNHPSWLNSTTFSWQSGAVYQAAYQHLVDDYTNANYIIADNVTYFRYAAGDTGSVYCWKNQSDVTRFTTSETPVVGGLAYHSSVLPAAGDEITDGKLANTETISGVTITYYQAPDGHKLVLPDQESNVTAIYNATGVAWYYIIDTTNQRFKLPRSSHNKYTESLSVVGTGRTLGLTSNGSNMFALGGLGTAGLGGYFQTFSNNTTPGSTSGAATRDTGSLGVSKDPTLSGLTTTSIAQDTDQYKYLYFYVGNFTQTALENTAGLNASLFNNKLDLDVSNATSATKSAIIGMLLPDYENAVQYTNNAPATYTTTEPCWICCKGSNLAYNMTIGNTTIAEFLYSANYTSSWVFCPAGCTLTRITSSQYNNFIVVPLKG